MGIFDVFKKKDSLIKKDWSASVVDLGDGVAGVEFHSVLKKELNPIDGSILQTIDWALDWVQENNYKGLVISGDGSNFCAGANLTMILSMADRKDWDSIEGVTRLMQNVMQKIRFSKFPVVAAPSSMALGGGCELILHCDYIQAHIESYIGLTEAALGILPAWGGCKELLARFSSNKNIPKGAP